MIETRRDLIPELRYGDVLLQIHPLYELENLVVPFRWRVVKRSDNTASFTVKFWVSLIANVDAGFEG
jgi:hypothetical protein